MSDAIARWLPIVQADKTFTHVQDFAEVGITLRYSDRYWVRDEDGRLYEASWTEGERNYWWDWDGESPVDPVEFMPHPLDPRWGNAECQTCNGSGKEARHQLCRDCEEPSPINTRGAVEE
ncbi:hypothetical protein J2Y63_002421 [Shinella sp. BE166]|uniref:hypothetical protein n=1 Tax=Shinella sp. BE166 TaxID=3373918 RepID=UPI003EB69880